MKPFIWKQEYELGILTIDEQHKELFKAAVNFFDEFLSEGHGNSEMLLLDLKRYVLNHFNYEEKLMKLYDYKEYQTHQMEHYQFTKDIIDMECRLKTGEKGINLEMLNFLNKWIIDHISHSDRKYVDLFKKRGQK